MYIVNSNHTVRFYGAIALGVLFIWLVAASIIKWRRFTYRIEDDEFRIEEGLFVTKNDTYRLISSNNEYERGPCPANL